MQPCNRIYYSTVHWRLNKFRAAYRSSTGALTVFAASGLHTHVVTGRSQVPLRLDYGRSPNPYLNQRLQMQLELLMMSGMPLEICWAFNERWNNKFYYKVASCWLFLLSHTTMHGSMNIKCQWIMSNGINSRIRIVQPTRCTCYLKLFILVKRSTCFGRSFRPLSGAENCVYSNGICRTAAANHTCCYRGWDGTSLAPAVWHIPLRLYAVFSSWWWTERPSETCRAFCKNK